MPVARRRRVGQAAEVLTYAPLIGPLVRFLTVDKGPWPAPRVDAIDALAAKYAADWPAWGHRKVAAMMRADGHAVSTSTVQRALRRRGCCCRAGIGLTANRGRCFVSASFPTHRGPHPTHAAQRSRSRGLWQMEDTQGRRSVLRIWSSSRHER